jgi:hypothetical protein
MTTTTKTTMTKTKTFARALTMATMVGAGALALAAPPEGGPPGPGRRPPEEAFTACANATEGDSCTVTIGDRTLTGSCHAVPPHIKDDAGKLVCMPPRPPRPPRDEQ